MLDIPDLIPPGEPNSDMQCYLTVERGYHPFPSHPCTTLNGHLITPRDLNSSSTFKNFKQEFRF